MIFGKATLLHGVEMSHSPVYEQDLIYNLNGHGYIAWTALEAGHLPEHAFSRNVYFSNRLADPSALSGGRKIQLPPLSSPPAKVPTQDPATSISNCTWTI